jgi:WD40 repeat protein
MDDVMTLSRSWLFCAGLFLALSCTSSPAADVHYFDGHNQAIRDCRVSSDSSLIATVAGDGKIIVRNVEHFEDTRVFSHGDRAFDTCCFTSDGKFVMATGNLEDLANETDSWARIDLSSGEKTLSPLPLTGSIDLLSASADSSRFLYVSAGKLFCHDIASGRTQWERPLYDSSAGQAVSSRTGVYAFQLPTEIIKRLGGGRRSVRHTDPCRLRLLDRSGQELLSEELPRELFVDNALLHFTDDHRLILCQRSGRILTWTADAAEHSWTRSEKTASAPAITYSARTRFTIERRLAGARKVDLRIRSRVGTSRADSEAGGG